MADGIVTVGCILVTEIDNAALSLIVTAVDGIAGGIEGLQIFVRIRNGETTNQYLDFDDNTFKTSGWVQQLQVLDDLGSGQYQHLLDVDSLSRASGDSLVAEYQCTTTLVFNASEIILVETAVRVGLTMTVNDGGGQTGLTATVRIRDAVTTNSYLDWADLTFKTSGWTTKDGPMTEIGDGHYHKLLDLDAASGAFSGVFAAEYEATDGSITLGSSDRFVGLSPIGVPPESVPPVITVISPPEGTPVSPDTVIVVEVADNVQVALSPLYAEFPGGASAEVVYNGTDLLAPYASFSTVVDIGNGGKRFSLRRSGGWPGDVNITFIPTDTSGNTV